MAHRYVLIGCALSLCTALAASEAEEERKAIAPDSVWSISVPSCMIDQGWDGGGVTIKPHEDHFDLGIYDRGLKKVALDRMVTLMLASNDVEADAEPVEANGVKGYEASGYMVAVQTIWLDRFSKSQVLRLSRDGRTLVRAEMPGLAQALSVMTTCAAANAVPDVADVPYETAMNASDAAFDASADAAAAAEAAGNAADAAASDSYDAMANSAAPK